MDRLRALFNEGRLVKEFRAAAGPLSELAAGERAAVDLVRAGQLLSRLDTEEVLRAAEVDGTPLDTMTVAITGHCTLGTLVAPLTAEFARHGVVLNARTGDFDAYLRDLRDPGSDLYAPDVDLALCVLDAQAVFDELPQVWTAQDAARVATAKLAQLDQLAGAYTGSANATLVLNTVPLLRTHTHQLIDHRSRTALAIAWREFNIGLLRLSEKYARVVTLDMEPLVAAGGPVNEPRMASYAKANLGDELLARYAREVGHLARTLRGRAKKVLVVDADNTLWDGILGDDGADGISAATTFRGEAFGNFQRVVKQIGAQGVLLAVSSKNDQEPVLAVLRDHPDMVLRESDFSRVNANWSPKDANLKDIAEKLNFGVDSFVFADDSPVEYGLVSSSLPQVAVVRLDDEPALHIERLLADGWFDILELTAEDRDRAVQYHTEAARAELLESASSLDDYLLQLGVTVTVNRVREHEIPRVAQLSLRTNQFNLTTVRLQPDDVKSAAEDPDQLVLSIRSADSFGDNGVVGAVFAHRADDGLHIDNMLLSCRVFARGIEQATLAAVLEHARDNGLPAVHGSYRPTAKNKKVRDFYPSLGFRPTGDDETNLTFLHDLAELPAVPGHLHLTADLETRS
ncbi:HAD-IIIC family phosphatase [Streptomyces sp. NPDC051569]|uniref:HAD-IIIC family phosphatase n=1 Tax=Streptomyces sp. NPDC051569 TaxID=3365661 RepID=UPI0037975FAB